MHYFEIVFISFSVLNAVSSRFCSLEDSSLSPLARPPCSPGELPLLLLCLFGLGTSQGADLVWDRDTCVGRSVKALVVSVEPRELQQTRAHLWAS